MPAMKERKKVEFEIRELHGAELEVLKPILEAHGVVVSFPHLAAAKVAFAGDEIVGYAIYQLVPHAEPLYVRPEYRGGDLTFRLAEAITDFAKEAAGAYVSIATSQFSEKILRDHLKAQVVEGTIFVGRA